jgi:quinol monooxygenase YgiN
MVNVIASIKVKEGRISEFLEIFKANVPNVLKENGCIEYFPALDIAAGLPPQVLDKNLVTIIEKWESLDALRVHLAAPHMKAYKLKTADMVESVSLKVLQEA